MELSNDLFFAAVEQQLQMGFKVTMTVKGVSMLPTLHDGEVLTISPLHDEPKVGEILLFRYNDTCRFHRLVALLPDGRYKLQGDNVLTPEVVDSQALMARLYSVGEVPDEMLASSSSFRRRSRRGVAHRRVKCFVYWLLSSRGRSKLRPWYFLLLAILMWAPLNGMGVPLDNYVFGLRLDHLLHASIYLLCPFFLTGIKGVRPWLVWLLALCIGLLTESVQYLLPYRGFDVNDLIANAMGVTLGWFAVRFAKMRR